MAEIGELAAQHHPENFAKFSSRINSYLDFFTVTLDGELAAISGIYRYDKWFTGLYRVADRSFYFPVLRETSLSYPNGKENRTILSHHIIPMQTAKVLEMGGIPYYSMLGHKNALTRSTHRNNEVNDSKFVVLDDLYFTCPCEPSDNDRCWQNIAVLEQHKDLFNDNTLRSSLR